MLTKPRILTALASLAIVGLLASCSTSGGDDRGAETTTTVEAEETTTTEDDETTTTTEGDTDLADRDEVIEMITDEFLDQPDLPIRNRDEAECLATDFVDIIGDDWIRFAEEDLDDFTLDDRQATALARAFRDCDIAIEEFFAESMVASGATEEEAACVLDEFGSDNIERILAIGMMDGDMDELEAELDAAVDACV